MVEGRKDERLTQYSGGPLITMSFPAFESMEGLGAEEAAWRAHPPCGTGTKSMLILVMGGALDNDESLRTKPIRNFKAMHLDGAEDLLGQALNNLSVSPLIRANRSRESTFFGVFVTTVTSARRSPPPVGTAN